jgi:hypothetical protein
VSFCRCLAFCRERVVDLRPRSAPSLYSGGWSRRCWADLPPALRNKGPRSRFQCSEWKLSCSSRTAVVAGEKGESMMSAGCSFFSGGPGGEGEAGATRRRLLPARCCSTSPPCPGSMVEAIFAGGGLRTVSGSPNRELLSGGLRRRAPSPRPDLEVVGQLLPLL